MDGFWQIFFFEKIWSSLDCYIDRDVFINETMNVKALLEEDCLNQENNTNRVIHI